jgi:hypothetical protein
MGNLIVADDEYTEAKKAIESFGKAAEKRIEKYVSIMEKVSSTAIKDGTVADNLKKYIEAMKLTKGTVELFTQSLAGAADGFLGEIDANDEYLY